MPQIIMAVVALLVFAGGYYFFSGKAEPTSPTPIVTQAPTTPGTPEPTLPGAPVATTPAKKYADGQYSADGTYTIPDGAPEKITVSLTLKDGIITAVDFTGNPVESTSKFNQKQFRDGYKASVVGKNIDAVTLTVVNGASLTSSGFNQAIEAIKGKAKTQA